VSKSVKVRQGTISSLVIIRYRFTSKQKVFSRCINCSKLVFSCLRYTGGGFSIHRDALCSDKKGHLILHQ